MHVEGPQGFWANMMRQWPAVEIARDPIAVIGGPPRDPTCMATPAPRPRQPDILLDGEKTGAALLFSGVFLALVGVVFTTLGWQQQPARSFEWTQLLGPILISVGGTFILTSVCKFGILSCWPCREEEEEVFVIPVREQTTRGHRFMCHGMNQPVATMLCIPPAYNFITQEVHQVSEFQPGGSANGAHGALPPYNAVCCVDNAALTAEEGSSARRAEADHGRSSIQKTEDDRGRSDEGGSTCSHPPTYEDIYPSF